MVRVINKYHVFKKNPNDCCCNPNAYRVFEEQSDNLTKVTTRLKCGNWFRDISVGHCTTNSPEHICLKKYGYTISKPETSLFKTIGECYVPGLPAS